MVTNRVGRPVRGDDFFGREQELSQCWESLDSDHLLLLAPRRVGKTSLMLRLKDDAAAQKYEAAYMSSAEATDEAAFVQRLYETVGELKAWHGIWQRLSEGSAGRMLKSIQKIDVGGFSVELGGAEREQWALLGEKLLKAIEQQEGKCLLLIDELPIFVLSLLRQDPSGERARRFLTWFRGLRQRAAADGGLRWLLAGSIGLDTVAARLNLGDTINDLRIFHLGPFSQEVADALLQELAATYELPLAEEVRGHILRRVGWTIPFYLQLIFSELRGRCNGVRPAIHNVDAVFDDLLRPAKKAYFDYWRQRLAEELGKPDAGYALALLNAVAVDENGASRSSLSQVLGQLVRNSEQRKEKLHYLLDVLESDGYIVDSGQRFLFRSPLLREFWVRRVLP